MVPVCFMVHVLLRLIWRRRMLLIVILCLRRKGTTNNEIEGLSVAKSPQVKLFLSVNILKLRLTGTECMWFVF